MGKDGHQYLSQEFNGKVLDLVEQKGFYPFEYKSDFEKLKEELPSKENVYSSLMGIKNSHREYENILKVWDKFEMKIMKGDYDLYIKCDVLLLADVFEKLRNSGLKNQGH